MSGKHDKAAADEQAAANLLLTGPIVIRGLGRGMKDALLPGRPSRHRAFAGEDRVEREADEGPFERADEGESAVERNAAVEPTPLRWMFASGPSVDETGPSSDLSEAPTTQEPPPEGPPFLSVDPVAQTGGADGPEEDRVDDRRTDDAPPEPEDTEPEDIEPEDDLQVDEQDDQIVTPQDEAGLVPDGASEPLDEQPDGVAEMQVEAASHESELPAALTNDEADVESVAPDSDSVANAPADSSETEAEWQHEHEQERQPDSPHPDVVDDFAVGPVDGTDVGSDEGPGSEGLENDVHDSFVESDGQDEVQPEREADEPDDVVHVTDRAEPEAEDSIAATDRQGEGETAAPAADEVIEADPDLGEAAHEEHTDSDVSGDDRFDPSDESVEADPTDDADEHPRDSGIESFGETPGRSAEPEEPRDWERQDAVVHADGAVVDTDGPASGSVDPEATSFASEPDGTHDREPPERAEETGPSEGSEANGSEGADGSADRLAVDEQQAAGDEPADEWQGEDELDGGSAAAWQAAEDHQPDEAAVEEQPVDDQSADEAVAEDQPADEAAAEDQSAEDETPGEPAAEEQSADEPPIEADGVDDFDALIAEQPDRPDGEPPHLDDDVQDDEALAGDAPAELEPKPEGTATAEHPREDVAERAVATGVSIAVPPARPAPGTVRPPAPVQQVRPPQPPRRARPMRERVGREAIGIVVLVVLALVCAGLITAVYFKTQHDAEIAAAEAANYTPPPLATPAPTATGPVVAVIGDGTTSAAASGVTTAQKWSALLGTSLKGTVDADASSGMGYAAKGGSGETFVQAAAKVPSNADVVVFFGGAADANISALSLAKAATDALSAAKTQAPDAKVIVVGPAITAGVSDPDLSVIRNTLKTAAKIAGATWIDPLDASWLPSAAQSASSPSALTAADEKTIASKMEAAVKKALG